VDVALLLAGENGVTQARLKGAEMEWFVAGLVLVVYILVLCWIAER